MAELCERVRAAGVVVEVTVDGVPGTLSAAADVVVYRVLQEALTNVVKHSVEARAEVVIRHRAGSVGLRVSNRAAKGGHVDGFGITGMRRRVEQVGGTLTAGARGGTFAVAAVVPRGAP